MVRPPRGPQRAGDTGTRASAVRYPIGPPTHLFAPMTVLLCHCTCPDVRSADAIASALVEERLAACASVQPGMASVYRWQGRIERAEEVLLLVKTTRDRLAALTARIQALHPYDLPEIMAFETVGGSAPWLDWVEAETRAEPVA